MSPKFFSDDSAADSVGTAALEDGSVTTAKLAVDAVTTDRIDDTAVTAAKIADGNVGADEIATDAVRADEIQASAVGADEIATDAVGADEIATDAVRAAEIQASAVGTSEVADNSLTASDLAADSVEASEIAAGAVGTSEIATDGVDSAEIAAGAVTASEIATGAITAADAAADMATQAELDAVVAGGLTDNTVTAAKLTAALRDVLGIDNAQSKARGSKTIATSETTSSTSYTALATADKVTGIVVPTAGLLRINYQALMKLTANATVAIFLNGTQIKTGQNNGVPAVLEHTNATSTFFTHLFTTSSGLASSSSTSGDSTKVTTGQAIGAGGIAAAPLEVFVAAGTYDVEVRFKCSSGTITVKERQLWVEAIGFPAE